MAPLCVIQINIFMNIRAVVIENFNIYNEIKGHSILIPVTHTYF